MAIEKVDSIEKVCSDVDISRLRQKVRRQAQRTREELSKLDPDGLEALFSLKFGKFGYHPLEEDRREDLFEQSNQTFHSLVQLAAAEKLLEWFAEKCDGLKLDGLTLNMGEESGRDIKSIPQGVVEAEVFAVKKPSGGNNKLSKEVRKLSEATASKCYVFFYAPSHENKAGFQKVGKRKHGDGKIEVWALKREQIMR